MRKNPKDKNRGRILVVDDSLEFRVSLQKLLEAEGFEVRIAADGRTGQQLSVLEDFDAVVSDIRMPELSGIELLHFIKKKKPYLPVILMTGFSELTETREAHELGASGFIPKPFERKDLLDVLYQCIHPEGEKPLEPDLDEQFSKLSIDDFVSGKTIRFDVYIRLNSFKYVKIAHSGEDIPIERIHAYKQRDIRYLHMKKEDFSKYVGFNLHLSERLRQTSGISNQRKLNFMKHTGELILEQIHLDGLNEESFDHAKTFVESSLDMISGHEETFNILTLLNSHADFVYAHSVGVSFYSLMIARELKWRSSVTLFNLTLGGLLHDIGKKEVERSILEKHRTALTAEEIKILESHPFRGAEILSHLQGLPGDVIQIALQHHENCMGLGFPSGLKKSHIHPLARLAAVANEFCNLALKSPNTQPLPPKEALQRLKTVLFGRMDVEYVDALERIFNKHDIGIQTRT